GGKVPEAVGATGFDAIIFKGKAKHLSVVEVTPEKIMFHPAEKLKGCDTFHTEAEVKKAYHRKIDTNWKAGCVVIGPAAENQVFFSIIKNDGWRCAGRAGTGTVMGSKNLKAVVFQGDCRRPVFDEKKLKAISVKLAKASKTNPAVHAYKTMGTSQMVKVMNNAGAFPTKYWQYGTCSHWENIGAVALHTRCEVQPHSCAKCFMSCGRMTRVRQGRHKGLLLEGPEYETIYAFGGLCMIDTIEEIVYLNHLCDSLGMDTITTGNLCAFAMEAFEQKKSDFRIDYGNAEQTARLIHMIAFKEGVGELLAQGIAKAAKTWEMEDTAVHVKGMEPAGYDPRVLKGMGLGYATSARGACHLRSTFYKPELSGMIPADQIKGKAELFVDFEDRLTIFDTFILCRFFRDMYDWPLLCDLVHALTGLTITREDLKAIALRISSEARHYNLQEGMKADHERLPPGLHRKLKDSGAEITEHNMNVMLSEYYEIRGWERPAN
ncbi:MAG: aldehyde ferredoxin oxidoreductase C-terminal domain-containing protein, partial [Pseudomonadota bacterium]